MTDSNSKRQTNTSFKQLLMYALTDKKGLALSFLFQILSAITAYSLPLINAYILDTILSNPNREQYYQNFLWILLGLLILSIFAGVISYVGRAYSVYYAVKVTQRLRKNVFERLQRIPMSWFDKVPSATVSTRLCNYVNKVQQIYESVLVDLALAVISLVVSFIILMFLNIWAAFFLLIPNLILFWIQNYRRKKTIEYNQGLRETQSALSNEVNESINNSLIIKAFNKEEERFSKYDLFSQKIVFFEKQIGKMRAFLGMLFMEKFTKVFDALFLLFVTYQSIQMNIHFVTIATLLVYVQFSGKVSMQMSFFVNGLIQLEEAKVTADHVFELLETPIEEASAAEGQRLLALFSDSQEAMTCSKDDIPSYAQNSAQEVVDVGSLSKISLDENNEPILEFKDVSFSYLEDQNVLNHISFQLEKGKNLAFVGHTGSGKSTIMNLLLRFYDVSEGEILFKGYRIKAINRYRLREHFSVVLQDPFLKEGTVFENLQTPSRQVTREEAEAALLEVAGAVFFERHTEGLDYKISPGASNLSTGERQLLAFTRAKLQNADILILDEATANIDSETESRIQEGIKRLQQGRSSLTIAHRLSTIKDADEIFVLDKGYVVEKGTHTELLDKNGLYMKLWAQEAKSKNK